MVKVKTSFRRVEWVAFVATALLIAAPLLAQTTGRIEGRVLDSSAAAVPGVSVSVTSPNLQGSLSAITDSNGNYRFPSLPPGTYEVRAELAGFKTVAQPNVLVGLDRTVSVSVKMEVAEVAETITVEAAAPAVDLASATTGVNVTADMYERIPLGRSIYNIARVAPGAGDDGVGPTFYGSTGAENQYIIEGLNTTGVEVGDQGKALNFDFVQEIEVKTGGLAAEYGRMTGGVINVLTKSGSNEFHGSAFGFFEGKGLQSDNVTGPKRPETTTGVVDIDQKYDFGGELGGYLVKDKLWFFGAYNRVKQTTNTTLVRALTAPGSPGIGSVVPTDISRNLFAGKLTYRLTANHTLTASAFGDPSTDDGAIFAISGPESTWKGTLDTGSTDLVGRYDGVFSSSFLVRAMAGRHKEKNITGGPGKDIQQLRDSRVSPINTTGGFAFYQDSNFKRDVYRLDLTKFAGSHELKAGGDFEKIDDNIARNYGGGQLIYEFSSAGRPYFRHRFFINDRAPGFNRDDPSTWQIASPLVSKPSTDNISGYLQDSWKVVRNLTLNLGVRWERQKIKDRDGASVIDLKKNWAPRVGFVWDVKDNGKSKLYANYGRFFEAIPQDINIRSFGGEVLCFCYNFSSNPADTAPDPSAPRRSSLLGGSEPVDPNLKGQYIDEFLGGFEYEVAPNLVVGVKGAYRKLGRVIEDFLVINQGYFVANPAEGTLGKELTFYDYSTAPSPKAKRTNKSLEVTARKRFSNNWQLLASYVWSKLNGNYDGLFQNSTGQLDPNINSAFDYADFLVNAEGRLSTDIRHQLKFDGSYQFSKGALDGLNFGLSTHWYAGLPLNAYGYSFAYANFEYYLVPRGSLGTGPSDWEADVHMNYPVKLGGKAKLNLQVDVFNLFNRQAITQLDERYNLPKDGPCAGVPEEICNGDGGMLHAPDSTSPVGALLDPRATATNIDYLKQGISFTGQRSIRVGARLTF